MWTPKFFNIILGDKGTKNVCSSTAILPKVFCLGLLLKGGFYGRVWLRSTVYSTCMSTLKASRTPLARTLGFPCLSWCSPHSWPWNLFSHTICNIPLNLVVCGAHFMKCCSPGSALQTTIRVSSRLRVFQPGPHCCRSLPSRPVTVPP